MGKHFARGLEFPVTQKIQLATSLRWKTFITTPKGKYKPWASASNNKPILIFSYFAFFPNTFFQRVTLELINNTYILDPTGLGKKLWLYASDIRPRTKQTTLDNRQASKEGTSWRRMGKALKMLQSTLGKMQPRLPFLPLLWTASKHWNASPN